jgi:hypothetical protein
MHFTTFDSRSPIYLSLQHPFYHIYGAKFSKTWKNFSALLEITCVNHKFSRRKVSISCAHIIFSNSLAHDTNTYADLVVKITAVPTDTAHINP